MSESLQRAPEACPNVNERDGLTAALSRRAFVAALGRRAEKARRDAAAFGLCIVDLDRFRNVNFSHGPMRADRALRDAAHRLVRTLRARRAGSLVGRYDGDAFALVVETGSEKQLAAIADTLRAAVADAFAAHGVALTASVGAVRARIGESADGLLMRAEQTLYLAKQFGRDRIEVARSPEPLRASAPVLPLRRRA